MLDNEEFNIKLRLQLNKRLYEDKIIELSLYQKMENFLIKKLSKINRS